jgi:hypothetical protein
MHMVAIVAFVAFVRNARRNDWQFGLKTMFVVMTGVAIYAAVFALLWHAIPAGK